MVRPNTMTLVSEIKSTGGSTWTACLSYERAVRLATWHWAEMLEITKFEVRRKVMIHQMFTVSVMS